MTNAHPTAAPDARVLVAEERRPGSQLQLWRNAIDGRPEHELVMNGVFLMASYNRASSEHLVRAAIDRMPRGRPLRVLIGGLGMGFTAAEACRAPAVRAVDVVEISPTIIEWNRRFLAHHNAACLDDPRVTVIEADFLDYVQQAQGPYDIVAMDIDNGPALLVLESNRRAYTAPFHAQTKALLRPGGIFALWSCSEEPALAAAGREAFASCELLRVTERHRGNPTPYFIYLWQ
ncbi:MAG: spermine/spermidine synthase [Candidatus Hydrogenedentes bacterium]|nr:spermine/spermidine synthase [Candidatus Hydrogenedentota bacterium]